MIHEKLRHAIAVIDVFFPFLKIYPYTWDIQPSRDVPTMAVDYERLFYNPDFVNGLTQEEVTAVLIHEIFHCVFLHPSAVDRGISADKDPFIWNLALEQVVNAEVLKIVQGTKFSLPGVPVSPVDILKGVSTKGYVYDKHLDGMDSVTVYRKLLKHTKHKSNTATGSALLAGDIIPSKDDAETKHKAIGKAIATIELIKKSKGSLPAGLERLLKELTRSRIPFERILRTFVSSIISGSDDYSFSKPNTRHPMSDEIFIPDLIGYELETPVVVVDTSGSISEDELKRFASGIAKLTDLVSEITVVTTDAAVHEVVKIRSIQDILLKLKFKGGGGTDFNDVFKKVKKTAFMVFFTDGMATYPEHPPAYPVLWVLTKDHQTPPFGKVAYIIED